MGPFWGDLGGSQGGVQSLLLGGNYITNTQVLELGRFSVTCGGVGIFFVFNVFPSVVFVEWGVEFIVKLLKIEGFAIGPLRKVKENNDGTVGFGR